MRFQGYVVRRPVLSTFSVTRRCGGLYGVSYPISDALCALGWKLRQRR